MLDNVVGDDCELISKKLVRGNDRLDNILPDVLKKNDRKADST